MSLGLGHRTTGDLITASIWNTDLIDTLNSIGGKYLFPVPGMSLIPARPNGCPAPGSQTITAGRPLLAAAAFVGNTPTYAQFSMPAPGGWDRATITFRVRW